MTIYFDKDGKEIFCIFCSAHAVYSNGHTHLCESHNDAYELGISVAEDKNDNMEHLQWANGVTSK